ncbi:hypothetical protein EBZ38_05265 [bacterium]|nr:hypothetical protein [bacterium]
MQLKLFVNCFMWLLSSCVTGHISMMSPPSRHSPFSSYYKSVGLVSYNLRSPLGSEFTFPCKGFKKGPSTQTVTDQVVVTLEGTATHNGGHCQFGLSYDDVTFVVLKTVVKNCLLGGMSYTIDIPNTVPPGDVTVFWTWINSIGNREYYMECADITVDSRNTAGPLTGLELLVVNLPGYPTVPEFGSPGMYDGEDLLNARKSITIQPTLQPQPTVQPIVQPTVQPTVQPIVQPTLQPQPTVQPTVQPIVQPIVQPPCTTRVEECTQLHRCNSAGGYDTCVFNKWISRDCAPGTTCKLIKNFVVCA